MKMPRFLIGTLLLLLAVETYGQDVQTLVLTAKESAEKRLSPELALVANVGGEFLGLTRQNQAAIRVPESGLGEAVNMARSFVDAQATEYKPVSLLVSFAKDSELGGETLKAAGLTQVGENAAGSFVVADTADSVTAAELTALLEDKAVTHVEPNYILALPPDEFVEEVTVKGEKTTQTPNDPLFGDLWGMVNIHAPQAWDCFTSAPEVIVAVVDTGVDYKHPDLAANMWKSSTGKVGYDFFSDDDDPMDENRHGTHCSGTIAGIGNNGIGVAGVTWKTRIMAMRFLGPDGSGSTSDAIDCIDWAVENGAHILSNSWGGGGFSQTLQAAIARAENKGVLFVAAAGNENTNNDTNPSYPASYSNQNIIAVGAIDSADAKSSFSNYGKRSVDIGAPGSKIVSTVPNDKYASFNGTSMATPHVSGAAALIWGKTFSSPVQDAGQMTTVRDLILKNARGVAGLTDRWGHAAPAVVQGGVLDVGFLCGTQPPVEPPSDGRCPVAACGQFDPATVFVKEDKSIVEVKLHLDVASHVHIVANTSVTAKKPELFTIGFSDQSVDHIWVPSLRWVQVKEAGDWVNCGDTVCVRLEAGDHVLRWNVWIGPGAELEFDGGSMLVEAYPVATAGAEASAAVEGIKKVELKRIKDRSGNLGVKRPTTAVRSQKR